MALKKELVVDNWNTLVVNAAGRSKKVMDSIEGKIKAANIPSSRTGQREVSTGMFGTKRQFLIVANDSLPEFFLYIAARDYGVHLDVSWYLTVQPRGYKQMFSKYKTGSPTAMSMQLERIRIFGSFHETAKVVNSLFGEIWLSLCGGQQTVNWNLKGTKFCIGNTCRVICVSGSLHETAKVVNSLFGSATGIARLRQIQPSRERLPQ
jgi:hypothetical protein